MLPSLLSAILTMVVPSAPLNAAPSMGSTQGWNKDEDPYVLDGTQLISPWYQYEFSSLAAAGGAAGGGLVTLGALAAIYGDDLNGARPIGLEPEVLVIASGMAGATTAAALTAVALRPSQGTRSSGPAFVGASVGAALGFGIGIPLSISDDQVDVFRTILFAWLLPSSATALGAVLGDLSAEPRSPKRNTPDKPGVFRPISLSPTISPTGNTGLALRMPVDL